MKNINYNKKINKETIYSIIFDIIYILLGAILMAIGMNLFLLPHKMSTGGASGIATVIYYLFNLPVGTTILIINIPLFIISIMKLGLKFSIKTIISTVLYSIFANILTFDMLLQGDGTDLFTSCVFGGAIVGLGISLTFKAGASSGGSDLLAQIIYELTSIQSISQVLLVIELLVIICIILVFKDINIGLYSIISMFISTKVIDIIFEGIYYNKEVKIITRRKDEIVYAILNDLERGATIIKSIGAHSNKDIYIITCIITRPQLSKIKKIVRENDKNALIYISTVNEAIGNGFKELNN